MKVLTKKYGIVLIASLLWTLAAAAQPQIARITSAPSGDAMIQGSGFGSRCSRCEVIADFGRGFKYAYPVVSWSDTRVVTAIADINKGQQTRITLHTADGDSNAVRYNIPKQSVPAKKIRRPVTPGSRGDLLVFERKYKLSVGDKGEDAFDVSTQTPGCGKTGLVYDSANIVYGSTRFGEAQIVATPKPGCTRCQPLKVRRYHEPTGKLHFQVHVYRRLIEGICSNRVRR